jgi:hydroxymethylbilane synthase
LAALGGGCQVPIGIHCRPEIESPEIDLSETKSSAPFISRSQRNEWEWEIFAVVAAPESGKAVRVYHRAPLAGAEPETLGKLIAQKLIEAGAGPLLGAAGGAQ